MGVIAPLGAYPHNLPFGYDVRKISAGCLVIMMMIMAMEER